MLDLLGKEIAVTTGKFLQCQVAEIKTTVHIYQKQNDFEKNIK